ncbi:MAG: YvcK family protein [Thermoleophilaceae bacterium]|nr:YvcK family protein [Thermoleophilaceae bacterium]
MSNDLQVVAFGGGTGLPVLLRGLRDTVGGGITAVVTVTDDGGSSGRLRQELGVAPPGDVRNCLVALASRRRLAEVFDYRFEAGADLRDHAVGNIIIAALTDISGGFSEGVQQAARLLRITGKVYPAATESLTLVVRHADGTVTRGESRLREVGSAVARVAVEPEGAAAPAEVIQAIHGADVVVLAPGSLFTSTIPALLGAGVPEALAGFTRPVVYAANVMTQPGETSGFTVADHLRAITEHVGTVVTDVLVPAERLPERALSRYRAEGAAPVETDREEIERLGIRVWETRLIREMLDAEVRHDPGRLARAVRKVARRARRAAVEA